MRFKPVVFVTGCSSGIGLELAKQLWKIEDYKVVVTCRKQEAFQKLNSEIKDTDRYWIRELDINRGDHRRKLIDEINQKWGGVDILINNAGISYRAVVEHMDDVAELQQLRTNYLAPMALIRLVLPGMREKGRGKIINVSSVSGMLAMPTMSSYSASKHALEGASESLWYEMKPLGINVTLVQPGFVRSTSFEKVYYPEASVQAEREGGAYADYYRNMAPFIASIMQRSFNSADDVAAKIIKVIRTQNPPLRIPATLDAILFYYLHRWIPRRFFHQILFWCLPGARRWAKTYSNRQPGR